MMIAPAAAIVDCDDDMDRFASTIANITICGALIVLRWRGASYVSELALRPKE